MNRRDISNMVGPLLAVDLDALLLYPENPRQQLWLDRMQRWKSKRLVGGMISRIERALQPITLRWHKLSPDAERVFWWFHAHDYRIAVVVRKQTCAGLLKTVEDVLGDFPVEQFLLVYEDDLGKQAYKINSFCRTHSVLRFFTSDERLFQNNLSRKLAHFVYQWDETVLSA